LQILSKVEARFLIKYLKVNNEKIRIVDNGINLFRIKKKFINNSNIIKIIFIGSLNRKEKSFDFLLAALTKIKKRILLNVYSYHQQENENLRIPPNVQLNLGNPLNEIELRKEFCNNDLFIIPSRRDTFPLSLLEAMDTGILFISSDRVGLTERFPDSFNKFLIPYGNVGKLKDKILELHNLDYNEKNKLTDEIRMFASGFSWDKVSEDYVNQYKNLLSNK
jgi:glycosyltransferase involved in cell wall biosynthesis